MRCVMTCGNQVGPECEGRLSTDLHTIRSIRAYVGFVRNDRSVLETALSYGESNDRLRADFERLVAAAPLEHRPLVEAYIREVFWDCDLAWPPLRYAVKPLPAGIELELELLDRELAETGPIDRTAILDDFYWWLGPAIDRHKARGSLKARLAQIRLKYGVVLTPSVVS